MRKVLDTHGWLLTILVVGVVLRVVFIFNQGFMSDELSAWFRVDYNSFSELIDEGVKRGDMHPAFYQVLLFYWSKWFGTSEFILRFPALLFYISSCLVLYKIANSFFTKWAGVVAVLFLSTLVFPIIDTTLTRPYTAGIFFSLLFFFGLFKLFNDQKVNWFTSMLVLLGAVGAMYSHYFAFFTVGCVGILSLFFIHKKHRVFLILMGIVALICFLPHWTITAFQLSRGGLQWLPYPDKEWFFEFVFLFLNQSELILCIAVLLPVLAYFGNKYKSIHIRQVNFSVLAFFSVLVMGYLVSYLYTPVLREKGLLFVLPLGLLAYGNAFSRFKEHHRFFILSALFICFTVNSIWFGKLYKPVHYGALKEIAKITNDLNEKYGEDNILHFGNFVNPAYFDYYYDQQTPNEVKFARTSLWSDTSFNAVTFDVHQKTVASNKPYTMLIYSNMTMHPLIYEIIQFKYPFLEESHLFFNSGILLFSNKKTKRVYRDSISPSTHSNLYQEWKETYSDQTYLGELKISVGKLRELQSSSSQYFLILGWGEKQQNAEYRTTVVAERNGLPIEVNAKNFALYQHFDMQQVQKEGGEVNYFLPFKLTDNLKNDDIVKVFIQNNDNKRVSALKPKIYVVDLKK